MSQGSAHECFTRPSPSLAFTRGTGVIDYPQNCGQKSSNRSVCASSLLQTRRLCPTRQPWEMDVTRGFHVMFLLQDLGPG